MHYKYHAICAVTALIVGSTLFAVPHAYAANEPRGNGNIFSTMFQRLSQMFGGETPNGQMQKNDMANPPEENGTPMPMPSGSPPAGQERTMGMNQESRLAALVKAGKITEAQKTAILEELQTIEKKMQALQDELKAWAKAQGIDETYVLGTGNQPQGQGPQTRGNK